MMPVIYAEEKPQMTREQWEKAKAYADKIASVGGSLLSNASNLRKLLATVEPPAEE